MTDTTITTRSGVRHFVKDEGAGAPLVLIHSLGTDMSIWDGVCAALPDGLRVIRYDLRGHGQTDVPPAPYSMGNYISDAEDILDQLGVKNAAVVGLSVGGKITQGLAIKRLDLVRVMVLSNTAAKTGRPEMWQDRIDAVKAHGLSAFADATMERWFSRDFQKTDKVAHWRDLFLNTNPEGYIGCCAAIAGTDFYTPTSGLRLPTLGIAGSEDGATPPDLVRETTELVPGSKFHLIRHAGHIPCIEKPKEYADILENFLRDTGHI